MLETTLRCCWKWSVALRRQRSASRVVSLLCYAVTLNHCASLTLQVLDFADTVFIIARGKWKQLSFLHYYHHVSIFMIYW